MKRFIILFFIIFVFVSFPASAATFECAFLQDKYASGKSNKASCSMLPEKVYSTKDYSPKKNEHCEVEAVYSYEDLENVKIDTEKGTVSWVEHTGLTDETKQKQKEYYLKQGKNAKEADEEVNIEHRERQTYQIKGYHKSQQPIYFDPLMKKPFKPRKEVPAHTIIFADGTELFYLYIPESSGHAILLRPTGMMDSSWVEMKFGNCRKLK
jgi:hypothetical protein